MKRLSFLIAAFLVAVVGCQKEPQGGNSGTASEGQVYMSFRISTPATKSQTDENQGTTNSDANPDYEVGFDRENKISTVDIFLHNETSGLTVFSDDVTAIIGAGTIYSATFDRDAFTDGTYKVYVVCNGTNGTTIKTVDDIYSLSDDDLTKSIAKDNFFLMTNAKKSADVVINAANLQAHTVPTNPFDLGTVEVERAAARFDYRAAKKDNIYNLDETGAAGAGVQLTHAALINHSKDFYYFRRVSADGTATDWDLCGTETKSNYVVDTDWELKNAATKDWPAIQNKFFYHMDASAALNYTELSTLTTADNLNAVNGNDGYCFWRYAAENTIPGTENQVNGVTTGVVFKGRLVAADGTPIKNQGNVYVHNNVYYGNWEAVKTAADQTNAPATLKSAVAYVESLKETDAAYATRYTDAAFTVYEQDTETGEYNVLYYYWNRHNDNGDPNLKGVMEFAVVRNNVYKLAVTKINKFGVPEKGETPDEPDPDDPDEDLNYYFTVSVKVLPWVVRVNDIEF